MPISVASTLVLTLFTLFVPANLPPFDRGIFLDLLVLIEDVVTLLYSKSGLSFFAGNLPVLDLVIAIAVGDGSVMLGNRLGVLECECVYCCK